MSLHARIDVRRGDFHLDVDLHARAGRITVVLGPNGAGKTTLLQCLTGALPLDDGEIVLADTVLDRPSQTFLHPRYRNLGIVHQDHVLFPHLDARDNVAFGLRSRQVSRRVARDQAQQWLDRLGIGDRARLKPRELSGGQSQRVALARALAVDPNAVLLDEPLAALDVTIRPRVRAELKAVLSRLPGVTLLITHDPADVLELADDVVVLETGRIMQAGTLAEVRAAPATDFLIRFLGTVANSVVATAVEANGILVTGSALSG